MAFKINSVEKLDEVLEAAATAFGGYDLIFFTQDGGALCRICTENERENIVEAITEDINDGWLVNAAESDAAYDPGIYCDHCNDPLSAYEASDDD